MDKPPFDERAALEELERLRRNIESYRARRKALGEEFEAFVQSFRTTRETWDRGVAADRMRERAAAPVEPPPQPREEPIVLPPPVRPEAGHDETIGVERQLPVNAGESSAPVPPAAAAPANDPVAAPQTTDAPFAIDGPGWTERVDESTATPLFGDERPRKFSSKQLAVVAAGALILLVAAVFLAQSSRTESPASTPAAPAPAPEAPAPVQQAPSTPAAPAPIRTATELVTTGRAWVRVTVDGQRLFERELPAGTRVPLNASQSIVIRTGDAGAVRLLIRGVEQPSLGGAGEVVTRTFKVPPAPR